MRKHSPPFAAKYLLQFFLNYSHSDSMIGDYEELYSKLAQRKGPFLAWLWFWGQILLVLPLYVKNALY